MRDEGAVEPGADRHRTEAVISGRKMLGEEGHPSAEKPLRREASCQPYIVHNRGVLHLLPFARVIPTARGKLMDRALLRLMENERVLRERFLRLTRPGGLPEHPDSSRQQKTSGRKQPPLCLLITISDSNDGEGRRGPASG